MAVNWAFLREPSSPGELYAAQLSPYSMETPFSLSLRISAIVASRGVPVHNALCSVWAAPISCNLSGVSLGHFTFSKVSHEQTGLANSIDGCRRFSAVAQMGTQARVSADHRACAHGRRGEDHARFWLSRRFLERRRMG